MLIQPCRQVRELPGTRVQGGHARHQEVAHTGLIDVPGIEQHGGWGIFLHGVGEEGVEVLGLEVRCPSPRPMVLPQGDEGLTDGHLEGAKARLDRAGLIAGPGAW